MPPANRSIPARAVAQLVINMLGDDALALGLVGGDGHDSLRQRRVDLRGRGRGKPDTFIKQASLEPHRPVDSCRVRVGFVSVD
jgi:hypothetical protein